MTTILNHKLSYALETKEKIFHSLQKKGAKISETTPFRAYSEAIDALSISNPTKKALSGKNFPIGQKVMIQTHQKNMPLQSGSFHGALNGTFNSHPSTFSHFYENNLFFGFQSSCFWQYHYNEETKTISPIQKQETTIDTSNAFANKAHPHLGNNYVLDLTQTNPFIALTYPSGGNFTSSSKSYSFFDSNGDYLIQYNASNGKTDILKYVYDETNKVYSYELVQSFIHTSTHSNAAFTNATGDIHTTNTFSIGGKTIFKINKETNALSSINISEYALPVSNADILLFGKNYLILTQGYSSNPTISFIKATPIDETLALEEEGFYDNPSNYTYTLLHQEKPAYFQQNPLFYHPNNIYSPLNAHVDYYIHVEKEKIDDITDFHYQFFNGQEIETYALYLNEYTSITHATKTSSSGTPRSQMLCLNQRESITEPFTPFLPLLEKPCFYLNELGFGVFYHNASVYQYRLTNNALNTSYKQQSTTLPYNLHLKNGHFFGSLINNIFYYNTFLSSVYGNMSLYNGFNGVLDEDFLTNTQQKKIIYLSSNEKPITLTSSDLTTAYASSLMFKYKGEIYFFNFLNQMGDNLVGTCQKVSINLNEKTFSLSEKTNMTGSFSSNQQSALQRIKNKDLLISKTNLFGVSVSKETGLFHFQEIAFPDELINAFNGQTPYSIQTFYDGSCAFQLENGITLVAFLEWDETSNTANLAQNTTIETIQPDIQVKGSCYTYLSPFKIYKYIYNPTHNIFHCSYTNPSKQEIYDAHIEENKQESWNETTLIGYIDEEEKTDDQNYPTQTVLLKF